MENFKSFITEAKEEKYRILVISAETAPGKKPLHRTARRFVEESKKTGNDIYVVRVEGAFITYDNGYKIFNANDKDGFEKFRQMAGPTIAEYGGKVLIREPNPDVREGKNLGLVLVIDGGWTAK